MNIQASRMLSALTRPDSAAPTRSVAAASATHAASSTTSAFSTSDTVTISQAAKDLLAQSQASASLSSRAMDLIQRRNPFGGAPGDNNPQVQVRKVMDNLAAQHNNRQISDNQYQHDVAFYTRVSSAIG